MNRQEERAPRRRCTELVEQGEVIARPGEVVRVQPRDEDVTVVLPEPSVANDGQDVVVSFEGDGTAAGKVLVVPMAGTCAKPGITTLNSPGSYHFTSTGGAVAKRQNAAVPTDPGAPTSSPGWSGPGPVVTDDLPDDGVTNDKLDEMPGNSVKVNATAAAANPTDLTVAADSFVGRLGGNLDDVPLADVDSTSIVYDAASHQFRSAAKTGDVTAAANSNTFAFRSFSALSVLARAANSSGVPTELAAGANDRVLARSGDTLAFQQVTPAMLGPVSAVEITDTGTLVDIAKGADEGIFMFSGAAPVVTGFVSTNTPIGGVLWAQCQGSGSARFDDNVSSVIANRLANYANANIVIKDDELIGYIGADIESGAGVSRRWLCFTHRAPFCVTSTNAAGDALVYNGTDWAVAAGGNSSSVVLRGDAAFGQVLTGAIADDAVTDAKLRESAALSVIGRSANSTGNPADISTTSSSAAVLRESGGVLGFGTVATAGLADDAVTDAKLRESAALSVIGRSANSTGNPADISAGTDGHVLRRSGTTLGFGTVATAGIADDAVTPAKLAKGVVAISGTVNAAALASDTTALQTNNNLTLNGIANGSAGRVVDLNAGGNHTVTVNHASASAAATDQIFLTNAVAYGPATRGCMRFRHDGSVWREVSRGGLEDSVVTTAKIADGSITLAKMANLAQSTIIGRAEGAGTGVPQALTPTQVVSIIDGESPTWSASHRFDSYIQFGSSTGLPASGDIRKGSGAALVINSGLDLTLSASDDIAANATDDLSLTAGGDTVISGSASLTASSAGDVDIDSGGTVVVSGTTAATISSGSIISLSGSGQILIDPGTNQFIRLNGGVRRTNVLANTTNGTINNLDIGTANTVRFTQADILTGMVPAGDWQEVYLVNASPGDDLRVDFESISSTSTNCFAGFGTSRFIRARDFAIALYDPTTQRWRLNTGYTT